MSQLLIKNGRVIDPASATDMPADVLIRDGAIAFAGAGIEAPGAEIFDATGLIVTPGFIDMHVHLREPGFEYAETIETGARAAAAGGSGGARDGRVGYRRTAHVRARGFDLRRRRRCAVAP